MLQAVVVTGVHRRRIMAAWRGPTALGRLHPAATDGHAALLSGVQGKEQSEVATPASVDFEALQHIAPAAVQLLALCAFLAPDDIPLELLRGGQRHVPQPLAAAVAQPAAFKKALAALRRYARVERVDDALWVPHGLSVLVYDWLDAAERAVWATAAVTLVNEAVPTESTVVENWSVYARLLPHALAATRHAEACAVAAEATARVLNGIGVYLYRRGQFHEACGVLERAFTIYASALGAEHPATACGGNNLALVYVSQGRYADAEPLMQRAFAIHASLLGAEHRDTATSLMSLGVLYMSQGRYADAEPLLQQAVAISKLRWGRAHPETAVSFNNLAALYEAQGRYQHARPLMQRALMILRATLGDGHPHTQGIQCNLAALLQHLSNDNRDGVGCG